MTVEDMLYDVLSQMTPEQLKHQSPNVRSWYTTVQKLKAQQPQVTIPMLFGDFP